MASLSDVNIEELEPRLKSLLLQMGNLAEQFGPLLTQYGHFRVEAEAIIDELKRRGIIKKDG